MLKMLKKIETNKVISKNIFLNNKNEAIPNLNKINKLGLSLYRILLKKNTGKIIHVL